MREGEVVVRGHEGREIRVPYRCPFLRFMSEDKDQSILDCVVALARLNMLCHDVNGWPGWAVLANTPVMTDNNQWNRDHMRRRVTFVMYNWELIESQNLPWAQSVEADLKNVYKVGSFDDALREAQTDMIKMRRRAMSGKSPTMTKNVVAEFFCSAYERLRYPTLAELIEEAGKRLAAAGWLLEDNGDDQGYVTEITGDGIQIYPKYDDTQVRTFKTQDLCSEQGELLPADFQEVVARADQAVDERSGISVRSDGSE